MDTAYDGSLGSPVSFTFTPLTGTPFGSTQAQGEKIGSPTLKKAVPTFTPVTGANANTKQFVVANTEIVTYSITWTYLKAAYLAAYACWSAGSKGTLVLQWADGLIETWVGAALTDLAPGETDGTTLRTGTLMFTAPGSPTLA